jgi:hypothetical protein
MRVSRSSIALAAGALPLLATATAAAAWAAYAAVAWARYDGAAGEYRHDPLLDPYMPSYEVEERFQTRAAAPASVTFAAACSVQLEALPVVRTLFRTRELMMRVRRPAASVPIPFVEEAARIGWRVLGYEAGRALVFGAVTQPWRGDVTFTGVSPARFAQFDAPGFAQIVWTLEAEPLDDGTSVFRTVTRVRTTDARSRTLFRRYWAVFSPGIRVIRRAALRAVRAEAERRAGAGAVSTRTPTLPPVKAS